MTRRRWIADEFSGDRASLLGDHAGHLARVLRAHIGQEFDIAVAGTVRRGQVVSVTPERVDFELGEEVRPVSPPPITVALAIFKFDRFEWALEKLTELGASSIMPFGSRRSDSHLLAAATKRLERWRRVVHAASEQSRRSAPPVIAQVFNLRDVLSLPGSLRLVLSESASHDESLVSVLESYSQVRQAEALAIAIGPEGGWTEDELRAFNEAGWKAVSLGMPVLRSETAAIAALAIASALWQ